jgi:hypothetical protein
MLLRYVEATAEPGLELEQAVDRSARQSARDKQVPAFECRLKTVRGWPCEVDAPPPSGAETAS